MLNEKKSVNESYFLTKDSDIYFTQNTGVVTTDNDYTGIWCKNGFVYVKINFKPSANLTSGTAYYPYTISSDLKNIIGEASVYTTLHSSGGALVECKLDSSGDDNVRITPRASVSNSQYIRGFLIFPLT